jgi:hypothetical protein
MESLLQKLRSNLSGDSLDIDPDLSTVDLQHALDNPYIPPSTEKLSSFHESLDEYKFNQKLQIISVKRQHIPNLQVISLFVSD